MSIDELFTEAGRQLTICNACRYCEGYCAVFPALELRTALSKGDITHLANLCHDCRACFHACMYTEPHEFALNPPAALSRVRLATYESYARPARAGTLFDMRGAATAATAAIAAVLCGLIALGSGHRSLVRSDGTATSPYEVIPHPALLALVLAPSLWAGAVVTRAAASYWRDTHGTLSDLLNTRAWTSALHQAMRLRYLRGGGDGCYYPRDRPSGARRRLHAAVFYGFLLNLASTTSAAIMQDVLHIPPPYPVVSAPVLLGGIGGAAMIAGCTGLIVLKRRSDPTPSDARVVRKDYGMLVALNWLALTGMLTLFVRATPAFPIAFVTHLAAVLVAFTLAPYSKFVHFIYRLLALVHNNLDAAEEVGRRGGGDGGNSDHL